MEHAENNRSLTDATGPVSAAVQVVLGAHPNMDLGDPDNLIVFPDSDDAINRAVARFQDGLTDWTFRSVGLAGLIRSCGRDWARDLWTGFMPAEWHGRPVKQPQILFRFEWKRPRVLGHYRPGRNDLGFRWEISINPRNVVRRSEVEVAETVLHELLHCFEDLAGSAPRSANNYHSSWFRKTADRHGIPCTKYGTSLGVRDGSPFMDWARQRGLKGEPAAHIEVPDVPPVHAAKRAAWVCACPRGTAITVQVPRGSELRARCERCGARFERKEA